MCADPPLQLDVVFVMYMSLQRKANLLPVDDVQLNLHGPLWVTTFAWSTVAHGICMVHCGSQHFAWSTVAHDILHGPVWLMTLCVVQCGS